jgi:hypothetical protein
MEQRQQDKGLAESAMTTPAAVKTEMKEKDTLMKLKELLTPVDRNKPLEVKTASGLRG